MAEDFWEFKDKVKASTMGDESRGEEQGPKMRRSLSCDGLIGIGMEISSSSGRVKRGGEGFILGLENERSGSFSMNPEIHCS